MDRIARWFKVLWHENCVDVLRMLNERNEKRAEALILVLSRQDEEIPTALLSGVVSGEALLFMKLCEKMEARNKKIKYHCEELCALLLCDQSPR